MEAVTRTMRPNSPPPDRPAAPPGRDFSAHSAHSSEFDSARNSLLHSLRKRDIDPRVVAAFAEVPRERFVPSDRVKEAYLDQALPIGEEQTISQPFMIARMLVELHLRGDEKVLDIGTGSGYQAALLSCLCREVHGVEVRPDLLLRAREVLASLGYDNIRTYLRNGREGLPEEAPFDVIIVAAASNDVPPALLTQLAPGGRLALPLGDPSMQWLRVATRGTDGKVNWRTHDACSFVPLV